MIGKVLANRYRIGERIGGGGMALVYRAEDLQLGRDVAIKVLRGQFGSDEDFIRRFRREAQNAASLSHPNVVQIFDVGQEDDLYYIVMELVEGKTLKEMIQRHGPLLPAEAARIAMEILSALAHAHNHRIVHRDVKPHNILIARDGRVKVTDFGIARVTTTDTVTHSGSIMGSAHYFSPEQANGQPTGEKSDIYSMGIVLYEMVTGVLPFQGDSPITVALKHIRERVVPPSQLNPEVPVELEEVILRALEKEPEDRFASADEMRQALHKFILAHEAGQTHISSGDFPTMDIRAVRVPQGKRRRGSADEEKAGKPPMSKRRKWLLISLIAGAVLLLAAGGWAMFSFFNVPEVAVPDVEGLSLTKAQELLSEAKLHGQVRTDEFSADVPINHVISAEPGPGTRVKENRTIYLVISKGQEEKTLPNLIGKSEDEAKSLLEAEKFKVGEVTKTYSSKPEGTVLSTQPGPLTPLKTGATVNLEVSRGPLRVPDVSGKSVQEAQRLLSEAGLKAGKTESANDPKVPKDAVISTSPAAGTEVSEGATVDLIVSQGPAPAAKSFEKEVIVPGDAATTVQFRVVLVDVVGGVPTETVLFNEKRPGGDRVVVQGTYKGEAQLKVYADDKETQSIPLS